MLRLRQRSRIFGLFKSTEVVEIVEDGGHVVGVQTQEGFHLEESGQVGLTGQVMDSVHGGSLAGAIVRISGTELLDTTDANGWFEIPGVRRGDYLLAFSHPVLDTLRMPDPSRFVQVPAADRVTLLGVPSRSTVLRSVCPEQDPRWTRGVLWGTVTDAHGPSAGAVIRVAFGSNELQGGGRMTTDESGTFTICNVPPRTMTVEASKGILKEVVTLRMPENGFLRLDLHLARTTNPGPAERRVYR
jgi:hypothetical protein